MQHNRAIVFNSPGDPFQVLKAITFPSLPPPPNGSLNIRLLLSPVNPADINVIQGVYPVKPQPTSSLTNNPESHQLQDSVLVGGMEGLAEVVEVGEGITRFKRGDRVVTTLTDVGVWTTERCVREEQVLRCPEGLSDIGGATITVNPPTAWNLLHEFVSLESGDWVIQNGANSAVGQAVIQIAARKGFKTLNFVRNRDDLDGLKSYLEGLGATRVLTYDELEDKGLRGKIKEWVGSKPPRLLLNSVSGPSTPALVRLLSSSSTSPSYIVSYGAMSMQPLILPTGPFIFSDLRAVGYWQSRWNNEHTLAEREELFQTLADLKLQDPAHEIVDIPGSISDDEAGELIRNIISRAGGKKQLLRIEKIIRS